MTVNFEAIKFGSAHEALQYADANKRDVAILLRDEHLVVGQEDARRLQVAGVHFAYLGDHDGRIVTVPVND